jgi:hypothetical protein
MQQTMVPPMTLTVLSTAVTIVSVEDSCVKYREDVRSGMPGTSVCSSPGKVGCRIVGYHVGVKRRLEERYWWYLGMKVAELRRRRKF